MGERVVRAGSRLRMILNREQRQLSMTNPLYSAVIQIEMGDLETGRAWHPNFVPYNREAMVLRSDEDLIGPDVAHRMVAAAVPVGELGRRPAVGQADQLVSQADAKRRQAAVGEFSQGAQCVAHRGRVARTVGKKEAIRF